MKRGSLNDMFGNIMSSAPGFSPNSMKLFKAGYLKNSDRIAWNPAEIQGRGRKEDREEYIHQSNFSWYLWGNRGLKGPVVAPGQTKWKKARKVQWTHQVQSQKWKSEKFNGPLGEPQNKTEVPVDLLGQTQKWKREVPVDLLGPQSHQSGEEK